MSKDMAPYTPLLQMTPPPNYEKSAKRLRSDDVTNFNAKSLRLFLILTTHIHIFHLKSPIY